MIRLLYFLTILITVVYSINVLVYAPMLGKSHFKFMAYIASTLSEAGHNVTLLAPVYDVIKPEELDIKSSNLDIYYVEQDDEMLRDYIPLEHNMAAFWDVDPKTENVKESNDPFIYAMKKICANLLRSHTTFLEMKKRNFDVAFAEPLNMCGLAFFHELGIEKTVLSATMVHYDYVFPYIGEPLELSYVPATNGAGTNKMSIVDRYENYRAKENMKNAFESLFDDEMRIYRNHFGADTPDWRELLPLASLHFTNSNPYIDFPRPVLQKTIAIGGLSVDMEHIKKQKLDKEWDGVLARRNKTMLISFGSLVRSSEMPQVYRKTLLTVMKSLPDVTFIWKYETNETYWAREVQNVYFSKWVPQAALLADPRLTAFLTHGGLGSTNEIAYCGKPALMIPILFDQIRNANMLARHHGAIALNKKKLGDFQVLRKSVHDIIYDKSFAINAKKLAGIIAKQPGQPKDLLVKHTEFLAKYGPFPHMDPYGRHLNFFQQKLLDVYLVIGASFLLSSIFFIGSISFVFSNFIVIRVKKIK